MTHSFPARRFSDLSVVVEWPIIGRKADSSHFPSVKIMTSDVQQLFLLGSVREGRDRSPARRPARIARIGTAAALGAVGTTGRDREPRSEERRVGQGGVSTGRNRWWTYK